jgi:hypothetical protein
MQRKQLTLWLLYLVGLAPHAYPHVAKTSPGTGTMDNLLAPNILVISANYIESTLSSFTPMSWRYGCVALFPYTACSLPVSCNTTATGFDGNGKMVAEQSFPCAANGSVIQDQSFGTFGEKFAAVKEVGLAVVLVTAVALVDNLIAKLEQEECEVYYTGSYNNST